MDFSKSVIVIPTKVKGIMSEEEKKRLEIKACENFNSLDKKADLFCDDQVRLKYGVNKIIQDMEGLSMKLNLSQQKPPFMQNTIGLWRRSAFEKLDILIRFCSFKQKQQWKLLFYEKIDIQLGHSFIVQLKEPYFNQILYENYQIPTKLEPDLLKKTLSLCKEQGLEDLNIFLQQYEKDQEMYDLSQVVCDWCIQIEITLDILDRANLYEMCNTKQNLYIGDKVKGEFDINKIQLDLAHKNNAQFKDLVVKKALAFGVRKLQGLFQSKGLTWGTILSVLYSIAVGSANPIIAVLIGGMGNSVVGNALKSLSEYLEKDDKKKIIKQLIEELVPVTKKLTRQNEECEEQIRRCFQCPNERDLPLVKEDLKVSIEKVMHTDFDEYTFLQEGILKENKVGDWNIIEYADDLEEEDVEGDFANIGLPSNDSSSFKQLKNP